MLQSNHLNKRQSGSFFTSKAGKRVDFFHSAGAFLLSLSLAALSSFSAFGAVPVNTLPTGYSSAAGNVQFNKVGNTLNISSNANQSIANFTSFNIGQNAGVNVHVPTANSVFLGRVTGNTRSEIWGGFNSNGRIFLVNPNGILFGNTAQVNVGSLIASTLNITDDNFLNGKYLFAQNGSANGITNEGSLNAANGGAIVLLGGAIRNLGQISAPNGQVLLGVGKEVTLNIANGISANITIDKALEESAQGFNTAISNSGTITADGGTVKALARLSNNFYEKLVNNSGAIRANKLNNKNGVIELVAYTNDGQGIVANSGSLIALNETGSKDGSIQLIGDKLQLEATTDTNKIEARDIYLASGDSLRINSNINAENLSLRTGGGIEQSKAIQASNLDILASGSVNLTNSGNKISRLAANLTEAGSNLDLKTSGSHEINELSGIKGIYTNDGNVNLQSGDTLTIRRNIHAGNGDVRLTADKSNIRQRDGIIVADTLFLRTNNGNATGYTGAGNDNILTSINHLDAEAKNGNAYFGIVNATNKNLNIKNAKAGPNGTLDIETRGTGNISSSDKIEAATLYLRTAKGNATQDGSENGAAIQGNYRNVHLDSSEGGTLKTVNESGNLITNFVTSNTGSSSSNNGSSNNSYLTYLEQTIITDLNNGITSGSMNGSSTAIDDVTFRKIVDTFKNSAATKSWEEVQNSLASQGISVAGTIDHTFQTTLANGNTATIRVTGSFQEMYNKMRNEALEAARQAQEQKVKNELAQEKKHFDNIQVEKNRADKWNGQTGIEKVSASRQEASKKQTEIAARNLKEYEAGERARIAAEQERIRQEELKKQQEEWQKWWDSLSQEEKDKYLAEQERIKQEEAAKKVAEEAAKKAAEEQRKKEELEKYYNEYYLNWQAQLDRVNQAPTIEAPPVVTPPPVIETPPVTITQPPVVETPPVVVTPPPVIEVVNNIPEAPKPLINISTNQPESNPPVPNLFPQTNYVPLETVGRVSSTAPVIINVLTEAPANAASSITLPSSTPAVTSPLFYKDAPSEETAAPVEETPSVAEPVFYKPAEEAPAKKDDQPAVAKPVFYYPGLW